MIFSFFVTQNALFEHKDRYTFAADYKAIWNEDEINNNRDFDMQHIMQHILVCFLLSLC